MKLDVTVETDLSRSVRAQQVSAMFDVPRRDHETLSWTADLPIEERDWSVGLIVGPSGSGKTTTLHRLFGAPTEMVWGGASVLDDFADGLSIGEITDVCGAVGFSTIPAWLRPFAVLSNGEQFRVTLARTLLETEVDSPIVVDEFTSVVDRQVAKIGAHAAQKWVRKHDRRMVAATCHFDVIEWLQPDWTFEPATGEFTWRCLQPRPSLECTIQRVPHNNWSRYARFHYLTAELHQAATCFELTANEVPASFCGVLFRPHPRSTSHKIMGISRLVTLPDWQGLGLAFALIDRVAGAYNAMGRDVHMYPAHPSLIRSFDRSPAWTLVQRPLGQITGRKTGNYTWWKPGLRPCAVFRYVGDRPDRETAQALLRR